MSAPAAEPGLKLAERFRLEDRVSESDGATLWKAIDEVLARPVAVLTFDPDFPRVSEVVTAARAASRLSDPRLTQVFDAAEGDDGHSYVVSEWVSGETLADMLADGPLDPERAAALVGEAAEALAHAHDAGLAHLRLRPDSLVWTSGNTVKLLGVGIDAALHDLYSDEPAREDARGLGRLLYAGLTGHWPGDEEVCGLPPAPRTDEHICTPRQVTAGVPGYLDSITCRVILPEARRGLTQLKTPAELADALSGVPRPAPPAPPPAVAAPEENARFAGRPTAEASSQASPTAPSSPATQEKQPSVGGRMLMAVVVLLVMIGVGVGAWMLGRSLASPEAPPVAQPSPTAPTKSAEPKPVKPKSADGFDPLGDDKEEHPEIAKFAIDGKSDTEWHTTSYSSADLGRLKDGVGLILDMGKTVEVSKVTVTLAKVSGANVELRVGDARDLDSLKVVAKEKNVGGKVTFTPESPASGQYVLIWFTRVPNDHGKFRGTIYDVVVYSPGSA